MSLELDFDPARLAAFEPNGERAGFLYERMKRNLARSIGDIASACRGNIGYDESAVGGLSARLAGAGAVRPAFYVAYFDLLEAARRDDIEACAALLTELGRAEIEAPAFAYRRWGDIEPKTAERYLRFVNIDPETPVGFAPLDPVTFAEVCDAARRALAKFDAAAPEISGEIRGLVKEVVLVDGAPGQTMNFDGATSVFSWGALFLNANEHRDIVEMADGLSHESAHAHLFGLSLGEAFVENSPDERFPSPLRAEPRPLDGVFHAAYVSARMHYAHTRLIDGGVLSAGERARAEEARAGGRRAFEDGIATIDAHARLTALGRQVLDPARRYMSSAA